MKRAIGMRDRFDQRAKILAVLIVTFSGCASGVGGVNVEDRRARPRGGFRDLADSGFQSEVIWARPDGGCDTGTFSLGDKCTVCDPFRARDCYDRCVAGNGDACAVDGFERVDLSDAADLYQRACDLGSGAGCVHLARAMMRGEGRPKDEKEGMGLFEKMCEFGVGFACSNFAIGLFGGRGRARDVGTADRILTRGCSLGDELGCQLLHDQVRLGIDIDGAVRDAHRRVANCVLGLRDDCVKSDAGVGLKLR